MSPQGTRSQLYAAAAKSLQSCLTLCDPIDGSPPGSPVPGILQARTLEWVAISFSRSVVHGKSKENSHKVCFYKLYHRSYLILFIFAGAQVKNFNMALNI